MKPSFRSMLFLRTVSRSSSKGFARTIFSSSTRSSRAWSLSFARTYTCDPDGQSSLTDLHYAPLPAEIQTKVDAAIQAIS